jgi:hypothetical protein
MRATIALFVAIVLAPFVVLAQDTDSARRIASPTAAASSAPMSVEWFGVIEGYEAYTMLEPRRKLTVTGAHCVWQEMGKNPSAAHCNVTGNKLELATGAGSRVVLVRGDDGIMRGTFTLPDGKRVFRLAMHRSIDQVPGWTPVIENRGTDAKLVPYLGKWHGTRSIKCGSQDVDRSYEVSITSSSNAQIVRVHYVTQGFANCMVGINWRTEAQFNGRELEFLGDTKRFSLRRVGDNIEMNVYWKRGAKDSESYWDDGAKLFRR